MTKIIPKISTRGYYDLDSGKTLKNNDYYLYPKNLLKSLDKNEITIVIHGLRNDKKSANSKFILVQKRLGMLNYSFPVIGFSYDSNTKGAHLKKSAKKSLRVGQIIAKKNGRNLSKFILDIKKIYPRVKIRLIGHSLGTQVILHTIEYLSKQKNTAGIIFTVYFFGSSIPASVFMNNLNQNKIRKIISEKITNFYAPNDEVLFAAKKYGFIKDPLGLSGVSGKKLSKFFDRKVNPKNHRFASYAKTIHSFP